MTRLAEKKCVPCRGGVPPLTPEQIQPLAAQLEQWDVVNNHHLQKRFRFPDFRSALNFVNEVGEIAEREDHHPDIELAWGKVGITIWTHKIDGLTESDFIVAAKIDDVYSEARQGVSKS
jgi:4a-hydroxytetrahydrobiopterin dehydratase